MDIKISPLCSLCPYEPPSETFYLIFGTFDVSNNHLVGCLCVKVCQSTKTGKFKQEVDIRTNHYIESILKPHSH